VTKTAPRPSLPERNAWKSERLPSCHEPTGLPRPAAVALVSFTESVTRPRAPFSPRGEPPLRASARRAERLRASALSTICLAAPRAPKHADASDRLLPSHVFVRAPAPRGFPIESARAGARALPGSFLVHAREPRFGGPHFRFLVHRGGRCLPLAMCADAPLTPLSRLSTCPARARALGVTVIAAKAAAHRPREAVRVGKRPGMPSVRTRTFALRRPFERPAPACPCHAALPPRDRLSTPFHRRGPFGPRRPGYRSRVPLPPDTRFSLASATLADFCNLYTTHGHTQRAFDPRTRVAGTNRCRLRWPFDALPHRGLRATTSR